jgi:hypothetical protein
VQRREVTGGGGSHPCDLWWTAEGLPDGAKTKVNISVKESGLAVREESPNGGAKQWLAGGEWVVVAYLDDGENGEIGGCFPRLVIFIGEGRRKVWGEPLMPVSDASVEPDR